MMGQAREEEERRSGDDRSAALPIFVLEVPEDLINDVVSDVIIARVVRQLQK